MLLTLTTLSYAHCIKEIVSVQDYNISCLFNTGEVRVVDRGEIIAKYKKLMTG